MAAHEHPVIAGSFLALVVAGVLTLATTKLLHPTPSSGHESARHESSVGAQITEAVRLGQGGDMVGAARRLAAIVEAHPDNIDALFNLGIALTGMNQIGEADQIFARILEISPNDWDAFAERASLRLLQGNRDEAIGLMEAIPAGAGRVGLRLVEDPRWVALKDEPRVQALVKKHGDGQESSVEAPH